MMLTTNRILILFVSLLFVIAIATNLVLASSSSSSSSSSSFVDIDSNGNYDSVAAADFNTDQMIRPTFPEHWGPPPKIQTRDYVQLPANYGHGSGTLRNWILKKMEEDKKTATSTSIDKFGEGENIRMGGTQSQSSSSWTEKDLVGWSGEDAKAAILAEQSDLHVLIVPADAMLTMDYSEERVRILVDENGKVVRQPRIG